MMRKAVILLAILDVALAIYLGIALVHRRHAADPQPVAEGSESTQTENTRVGPTLSASGIQDTPGKLDWRLLSLADLHRCVANLRSVGCPEATIKDIILAEVNRRYAPRERVLKLRYEDYELWESPSPGTRNVLDSQMQLMALYNEKKALLRDLLGVDVDLPAPKALRDRSLAQLDGVLRNLPEAKRSEVRSIEEGYLAEIQKLKVNTVNFLEPADIEQLAKLKAERWRALAKTLTPDELVDFHLQTSSLGQMVRARVGTELTDSEFREGYKKILAKYNEAAANESADSATLMASMTKLRSEAMRGDVFKEVLGEQRWNEVQQAGDPVYQQLKQVAAQTGLSQDMVDKVYAAQKTVQRELGEQFSNPNLSPDDRQRLIKQYTDSLTKGMQKVLGDDGFKQFQDARRPRIPTQPQ